MDRDVIKMAVRYLVRQNKYLYCNRETNISYSTFCQLSYKQCCLDPLSNRKNINVNPTALFSIHSVCYKTHYDVLGIDRNATQKEIKEAYLRKGKKLHPDLHQKISDTDEESHTSNKGNAETWTAQFKTLNEAYSVLSKQEPKRIYDTSLRSETNRRKHVSYRTYDTFEERAGASYGYKVDPMYWNSYNRRKRKVTIAILCLLWCIFGAVAQFTVVFWSTKRTQEYMDQRTELYTRELINSMKTRSVNSKENGEDERLFALYKQKKEDSISNSRIQSRDTSS